jgi:hypothetical protein
MSQKKKKGRGRRGGKGREGQKRGGERREQK